MNNNASKFQALCVSKAVNAPDLELFIDGIIVRSEPRVKLFGIHIDQRLTFTYHITVMCKNSKKAHYVMCLMILIIHILTYCTQLQKVHCI